MKVQFIRSKGKWSAFTTINGLDVQEYGETEQKARENLATRISKSDFLLKGIKSCF